MEKLTTVALRKWIKAGIPGSLSDGSGLTFTLSKNSTVAVIFRYSLAAKRKELTLGRYPDLSLSDARKLAAEKRVAVQQGVDVARERHKALHEAARAWSVRRLSEDYLVRAERFLAPATIRARRQQLRDYVLPKIGHLAARDVTTADIVFIVESANKKSVHVARLVLICLREVFAHGIGRHVIDADPCAQLRARSLLDPRPETRPRVNLSDDELRVMLPALPTIGRSNALAVKILLGTGVRISELILAEWTEIDFERQEWTVPWAHSKGGKRTRTDFVVPLTQQVCGWFRELKQLAFESRFVLPIRKRFKGRDDDAHMTETTLNAALNVLHKSLGDRCRRFTPHDLRSTARSHLSALGVDLLVAERCLNHSLGGLVATYDKHDFIRERRSALTRWSDKIRALEKGERFLSLQLVAAAR
jgi:integrase